MYTVIQNYNHRNLVGEESVHRPLTVEPHHAVLVKGDAHMMVFPIEVIKEVDMMINNVVPVMVAVDTL